MIDLKGAQYVTTLAKYGTIRAASEVLFISSPALSMYIRNLESELGVMLFTRDKNRFVPTIIGDTYIQCAKTILEVNEHFKSELSVYLRKEQNMISIGIYRRRGISFMLPLLHSLKDEIPDIQFSFVVGTMQELEQKLSEQQIDYMLVNHSFQNPDYRYENVCIDELVIACPSSLSHITSECPDSPYPLLPVENLPAKKIIIPNKQQSIYPYISQLLKSKGINLTDMYNMPNMEIAIQSVAAEMGFCFTLASYIPSFSHIPSVIFCRPAAAGVPVSWSLVTAKNPLSKTKLAVLKQVMKTQTALMIKNSYIKTPPL